MTKIMNLAAIVLAAGTSARFVGGNKLLAGFHGTTVLGQTVQNLKAAGIETIFAVVGHDRDAVAAALAGVTILENPKYKAGLATSIAVGIKALDQNIDAALVVLGDMPLVRPATIRALTQGLDRDAGKKIAVPTREGQSGNPVLWRREFFSVLATLSGDHGAKHIIRGHPEAVSLVAVDDPGIHIDIDTRESLDAW